MNRSAFVVLLGFLSACTAHAAPVGSRRGPDVLDDEAGKKIREYTTEPGFLTPWVDHLPVSRRVPSPGKFLGYVTGTPGKLTPPDRINAYFRELARTSPRVQVFSMGKSHGGREMIVAAIADARLLAGLADSKQRMRELADPRRTDEARARALAASTPPTYYITAGLHSPETGPPEMVMELAYRLAVSEQDHIREIRGNVITLITPVLEMDGRARAVDWYYRYLTGVTDLEDSPPRMAPYWGDYTAHDNNRDGLQMSQPLTRNYVETFFEYLPVVSLDLHESVPFLYVSTGTGPYNDTIDPITVSEWQWMASYEVAECTKLGLRGVWTWGFYTGWYPGYLLWVTNNHNAIGRFYETFGNGLAGTFERELRAAEFAKQRLNSRQWYRPWPPEKEVTWSLRNNTNYMQTGVLASLQLVARNGDTLLYNFWKKHRNALERGQREPPHAFLIPAEQRDAGSLRHALWLLSGHRVEVHQVTADTPLAQKSASRPVTAKKGDYLVRMDQPYRNLAKTLLASQAFPKSAALAPYDDVAWSLDYMLGLDIQPIDDPAVFAAPVRRVTRVPELPGRADAAARWIIDHRGQSRLVSLRWALPAAARVRALTAAWRDHPAGSLIVEGADRAAVDRVARRFHLHARALAGDPDVPLIDVDVPRVALFHTWRYTQDSGWARYTLEQLGVPYTLINKDDLRRGKLAERFDVILVPSQGWLRLADMIHGIDARWGPMPYTRTPEFPSHGVIDASDDITGGMGFTGLAHLHAFIRAGGVAIGLGSGGVLLTDTGIARDVQSRRVTGTPGSHVTTRVLRPEHPLTWGFPETTWVFRGNLPIYDVPASRRGHAVMQFGLQTFAEADREADAKADIPAPPGASPGGTPGAANPAVPAPEASAASARPPLVLSGLVQKPEAIVRKPALLDVPVASGRVILFSWNPMHRYQNHHDFAFVGNALLFYNDFPAEVPSKYEMRQRESERSAPTP